MRARLRAAIIAALVLLLGLGVVGATGIPPAGAAFSKADLKILVGAVPSNLQVGKVFQIDFGIANVGVEDAASTRLDIELRFGNGPALHPVNPPVGCVTAASGGPFPETEMLCPMGPVKAGQSVSKAFLFTASDEGPFSHGAFAVLNGQSDPNPGNNDGTFAGTVGPAVGPGGGGSLLSGLQALVADLLAFLRL
jgi:hypothetical protein